MLDPEINVRRPTPNSSTGVRLDSFQQHRIRFWSTIHTYRIDPRRLEGSPSLWPTVLDAAIAIRLPQGARTAARFRLEECEDQRCEIQW